MAVVHLRKVAAVKGQIFQVLGEVQQFAILVAVKVRLPERPYPQPVLRIHDEVAPYIVEHDRVLAGVLLEFTPDHAQRFHLKANSQVKFFFRLERCAAKMGMKKFSYIDNSVFRCMHGNHSE